MGGSSSCGSCGSMRKKMRGEETALVKRNSSGAIVNVSGGGVVGVVGVDGIRQLLLTKGNYFSSTLNDIYYLM